MRVWVEPSALGEIAALPGHMRQRVRRAVSDLRETPRPSHSRPLEIPVIYSWKVLRRDDCASITGGSYTSSTSNGKSSPCSL